MQREREKENKEERMGVTYKPFVRWFAKSAIEIVVVPTLQHNVVWGFTISFVV